MKIQRAILFVFLMFAANRLFGACSGSHPNLTAASASQTDVNACVVIALNGDTINVPAGSQTWTSGITIPASIGISIVGAGQGLTVITVNGIFYVFTQNPTLPLHSTLRISGMTIKPQAGLNNAQAPIAVNAVCQATTPYCPNIRFDHLTLPSSWDATGLVANGVIITDNVFGVIDHNIIGDVLPSGYGVLIIISHSAWRGTGNFGDQSMSDASTFGTFRALYIENNTFNHSIGTDTGVNTYYGGARFVCRFNTFNTTTSNGNAFGACENHGTDTGGRARLGRQTESYGNTFNCDDATFGCANVGSVRAGSIYVWGNTLAVTNGSFWSHYSEMFTERRYRGDPWGYCAGMAPFDENDGMAQVYTGTISTFSGSTLTVSGTPWTASAYNFSPSSPGANYYLAYDQESGDFGGIASNTSSALTLSWKQSTVPNIGGAIGGGGDAFASGHAFAIYSVTLYAAGTHTGSSGTQVLTDGTKSFATNTWATAGANHSILDVTNGGASIILSNTATTVTPSAAGVPYNPWTFTNGDQYAILRATVCIDQPNYNGGPVFTQTGFQNLVPVPYLSNTQTVDPSYVFANVGVAVSGSAVNNDNPSMIADRDYFVQVSRTANTGPSSGPSPFTGSTGTGYGPLASRPNSCTTGVGYWANDQGSWNTSGNGVTGLFYKCTSTNTWTNTYTPYDYPHPLTANDGTPPTPGNSGTITASAITQTTLTLTWTAATDVDDAQSTLLYEVCQSGASVSTIAACEAATIIRTFTTNIVTFNVSGLSASTTYHFNVVSADPSGSKVSYTDKVVTTQANPDVLTFTTQPTNTVSGTTISPPVVVTITLAIGGTDTLSSAPVTLAISACGAALGGTVTVNAQAGVATFNNLVPSIAAVGCTMSASSAGMTGGTSSAFNVNGAAGTASGVGRTRRR